MSVLGCTVCTVLYILNWFRTRTRQCELRRSLISSTWQSVFIVHSIMTWINQWTFLRFLSFVNWIQTDRVNLSVCTRYLIFEVMLHRCRLNSLLLEKLQYFENSNAAAFRMLLLNTDVQYVYSNIRHESASLTNDCFACSQLCLTETLGTCKPRFPMMHHDTGTSSVVKMMSVELFRRALSW